jgi:hypothetical protein
METTMQETNIPSVLELFSGGFGGPSYSVKLVDGQLYYRDELYEKSPEDLLPVYPSEQQWHKFYDALNKLSVWEWEESYANHDVLDGTSWSV